MQPTFASVSLDRLQNYSRASHRSGLPLQDALYPPPALPPCFYAEREGTRVCVLYTPSLPSRFGATRALLRVSRVRQSTCRRQNDVTNVAAGVALLATSGD